MSAPWGYGCPLHPGDPSGMSGAPGICLAKPASGGKGRAGQACGESLVALVAAPEPGLMEEAADMILRLIRVRTGGNSGREFYEAAEDGTALAARLRQDGGG